MTTPARSYTTPRGSIAIISARDPAVLVLRYDWRGNTVVVLHNFGHGPREVRFRTGQGEGHSLLINLFTDDHSQADGTGRHTLVLEDYGYRWYRVGGLDFPLSQSELG